MPILLANTKVRRMTERFDCCKMRNVIDQPLQKLCMYSLFVLPHFFPAVTFDVQDWVTTTETEAFYAANNYGLNGADQMQEMFKPLLDSLYASGYNFLELDRYVSPPSENREADWVQRDVFICFAHFLAR